MKIQHAFILYIDTPDATQYMEECKASCEAHGVPVTAFCNFKYPITAKEVHDKTGFKIDLNLDRSDVMKMPFYDTHFKEQLCLVGHMRIWRLALQQGLKAWAVLEHDALVKRNFLDIDVPDMKFTFLGYRVDDRDDYQCPDDPYVKHEIPKFEGTHAYGVTATTALATLQMFDRIPTIPVGTSIDHYMGVAKRFGLPLEVVDPAPVIVPVEKKISHTQPDQVTGRYNMMPHALFMKGLINKEKYTYDEKENYLRF